MNYLFKLLLPGLILLGQISNAQTNGDNTCGTTGITPWFKWYVENREMLAQTRGVDTNWLYVPVTIQITGTDEGDQHMNLESAIIALNNMNQQFTEARIRFYMMPGDPFRYLDNSYWHVHGWDGGDDLINSNFLPNRLNAFVVRDPAGNCGYSWQDAIVLGRNCSGAYNTTWAHEAGHHFSLPHPFFGWEGETWDYSLPAPNQVSGHNVEKTDGSNCYVSGDFFCDTKPDYLNYRWSCNQDKESLTLQHDPNGEEFRSDASLYMSYSLDACASRFTPEQIEAMRTNLNTQHSDYLQITDPLQEISDDNPVELISPLDTVFVQYDNVTFSWTPVPNASLYTVEVGLHENMLPRIVWETVYNTTTLTVTKNLPNNKLLYWRVRPYSEWDLSKQLAPQQLGVFKTFNTTATNELERKVQADLSPNPVVAGLNAQIVFQSEEPVSAMLFLSDMNGRKVYNQAIQLGSGENLIDVPTDKLSAGLYFVSIQNESGSIVKRLAVIN